MLSILSDSQKAVLDTITMRLALTHALAYLEQAGYKMSERSYFRAKKKIQDMKLDRMHFIAKVAYEEQHLERIDRMELIENQMWVNYWEEQDPLKKTKILVEITNIQPYISSYYEATKDLIDGQHVKVRSLSATEPEKIDKPPRILSAEEEALRQAWTDEIKRDEPPPIE